MSNPADMPPQGDNLHEHLGPKAAEQHPFINEVLGRQDASDAQNRPFVPLSDAQFATGLRQISEADPHDLFRHPAKLQGFHLNLHNMAETAKASNDPTMLKNLIERIDAHSLVVSKHIAGSADRGPIVDGLQQRLDKLQPVVDKDLNIPTS
jgi:hypothetical protein